MEEELNQLQQSHRRRKRRLVVGAALAVIAMVFLAWYFMHSDEPQTKSASPASSILAPLQKRTTGSDSRDASNAKSRADLNSSSSTGNPKAKTFLESKFKNRTPAICGLTESEAEAYVASDGASGAAMSNMALAEVTRKFLQSDKLREKTLGLYLMANKTSWDAAEAERLNYPGCEQTEKCAAKPFEAMQQARSVNAEPLVKLALSSNDVDIYAAALYACNGSKTGACGSITYAHWAEIDADNTVAWLMAANEAATRKDSVAQAVALQRAAAARGYNMRLPALADVLTAESVQAQPAIAQSSVSISLIGISVMSTIQAVAGIGRYCSRAELGDNARKVTCDALANKIAEKDQTVMGAMLAESIGEKIGWNTERLQSLKDEYAAVAGMGLQENFDENMFSCETLTNSNQRVKNILTIGERAAARDSAKKSGKSIGEIADAYRNLLPGIVK